MSLVRKTKIQEQTSCAVPFHLCSAERYLQRVLTTQYFVALFQVKTPGFISNIEFNRKSGSPRYEIFDVVNYQSDEGWVKV